MNALSFETGFEAAVAANPHYMRFRSLPVGQELDGLEAMLLFSCFVERHIPAGTEIYGADTESDGTMYLILNGSVEVADRNGHIYESLQAGDVFGLFTFLDSNRLHSATITASRELTVLTLERSYFDLVMLEDPALGYQLLRFMFRLLSRQALRLETEYAAMHGYATARRV
ncbi:MAG TPA: cyclic nucleotide-binding domain-containing protein [Mariprofundaceae bacterium]|nr:cyclic nucleotide-binding domain-containing protein [Mariprofundaceae bacterium]